MPVRLRGLLSFLGGTAAFFIIAHLLAHPDQTHFTLPDIRDSFMQIVVGMPGAAAMAGLVELLTGKPIRELEAVWAGLAWWQKLILGLLFVGVGAAFVISIVFFTFA